MLGTTTPSSWTCTLATCLPVVSAGPGWLSVIETGCTGKMSRGLEVLGFGFAWEFWVGIQIQVAHYWCFCPWFPSVSFVSSRSVFVQLGICLWELSLVLPCESIGYRLLLCLSQWLRGFWLWIGFGAEVRWPFVVYLLPIPLLASPPLFVKYFFSVFLLAFC